MKRLANARTRYKSRSRLAIDLFDPPGTTSDQPFASVPVVLARLTEPALYDVSVHSLADPDGNAADGD